MNEDVFHELNLGSQRQFAGIRRKVQFFSTFAGGVIEALRELGFRLSNIEKESGFRTHGAQPVQSLSQNITSSAAGKNVELYFEQRDNDQCRVLIIPYRTDLPYLSRGRFTAQLGLELSRYSSDPDVLRQAMNVNSRSQFGGFLGGMRGKRLPKLTLNSPPDIKQPGSMAFELRGARLVVSLNVLIDLGKFRLSDFDLDIDAIKQDLQAYFYGLEKYLSLLLENFGSEVRVQKEPEYPTEAAALEDEKPEVSPVAEPAAPQPTPTTSATIPLARAQTLNLSPSQLPETLAELETPRRPRPPVERDRDEPAVGEPLQDISLPFDVTDETSSESNDQV